MLTYVIDEPKWFNTINTFNSLKNTAGWNTDNCRSLYFELSAIRNRFYLYTIYNERHPKLNEARTYLEAAARLMNDMASLYLPN